MTATTQDQPQSYASRLLGNWIELLASMRFAIVLLSVISIASVIGTVVKQNEPTNNYVNKFGPFWAEVFASVDLFTVYSAWWFMLIMLFLVLSTSLCIIRSTPKIITDYKAFKENMREQSLKSFPHRAEAVLDENPEQAAQRIGAQLLDAGWRVKLQSRTGASGTGWMVAAKAGAFNKIGYLAAHSAIVLICVGGLLDGAFMVRVQMLFHDKVPFSGSGLIADVPAQHRLSPHTPTFRGNLLVTEGSVAHTAILPRADGVLLQDLPFSIELKDFIHEYHPNGMSKRYASLVVIHDHDSGNKTEALIEVNEPFYHRGVNIFQSSYADGGSPVTLQAVSLSDSAQSFEINGTIGGSALLRGVGPEKTLEFAELRLMNVENFADATVAPGLNLSAEGGLQRAIQGRLGAGHLTVTERDLRNVGPSITYRLRDAAGQAIEFHNFMLPFEIDGTRMFMLGVREELQADFRYLRIPADELDRMDGFLRLRHALHDPLMRDEAVRRFVAQAAPGEHPELGGALASSATRALGLFAGLERVELPPAMQAGRSMPSPPGGLQAVSDFLEINVPADQIERVSEVLVTLLNGTLFELAQLSREREGLKPLERSEATQKFMSAAVISLSDSFLYPVPMTFKLTNFEHVQASVFQVTRTPGKNIVYLGFILLIIGTFAMFYVRERRLWVWLTPAPEAGSQASMALSSNRKLLDTDIEFERLKNDFFKGKT